MLWASLLEEVGGSVSNLVSDGVELGETIDGSLFVDGENVLFGEIWGLGTTVGTNDEKVDGSADSVGSSAMVLAGLFDGESVV